MALLDNVAALSRIYDDLAVRLAKMERAAGITPADALAGRQLAVLHRLSKIEAALQPSATASAAAAQPSCLPLVRAVDAGGSEVQRRLQAELLERGLARHVFCRAPPDYYSQPLEYRQRVVGAASPHHLCKSIVLTNTRAHPSVTDCSDPLNSKYYLVIVQYTARLHTQKLMAFVKSLSGGRVAAKYFNMRLAPPEVSDELTGFEHNGVSPIGLRTRLPIILSHRVAQLHPDTFFMGAGEVDLKVGLSAADFIAAYQPFVTDCTYDDGEGGEEEAAETAG
ncbi:hypothetical protein ACK3TF_005207 [Chlorella vulgaris]